MSDLISRQAAIDAIMEWEESSVWDEDCIKHRGEPYWVAPSDVIEQLPSAQPERKISNKEWIDFLVFQFDISRTSAKEMLHGMMRWKKEDNFKKQFRGEQDEID